MCWWLDPYASERAVKLRDKFNIKTYIETGTFRGLSIKFYAFRFEEVLGCEINKEYFKIAQERIKDLKNVSIFLQSSPDFLWNFVKSYKLACRKDIILFYLDAHFYNPEAKDRWIVLKELDALKDFSNGVIVIHDFDCNGLGHLKYDGETLNFSLVKGDLLKINPNFHFYYNTKEFSGVRTKEEMDKTTGITLDDETLETINYHNNDRLQHRGLLYCTPSELDLTEFELEKV